MLSLKEIMSEGHLTDIQADIILSNVKHRVLLCGRQSAKSTTLRLICYKEALENPDKEILYVLKTYKQAKELGYRFFTEGHDALFPKHVIENINKSDLTIELVNGSRVTFVGSENYDALVGRVIDLLIMDEMQSIKPEVWEYLQPLLASRNGKAIFAGTSRGFDHLYDLWWKGEISNPARVAGWRSWKIKTADSGTPASNPEALKSAKSAMSLKMYQQEYECSPYALSGQIFDTFDASINKSNIDFNRDKPLLFSQDYNVNPGVVIVYQTRIIEEYHPNGRLKYHKEELHALDEVVLENSNTFKMAQILKAKYGEHWKGRMILYPDASGNARKTSSITSDHQIMKDHGFTLQVNKANPAVTDRINATNALICDANGNRKLFINPRCVKLIRSIIGITYDSNGKMDKNSGLDHFIDAASYLIAYLYPIKSKGVKQHSLNPD